MKPGSIKYLFFCLLFLYLFIIRNVSKVFFKNRKRKNVFIKVDLLGDFVLFSGVLREFYFLNKEEPIVLVANKSLKEYIDECPYIEEAIYFDKTKERNIFYLVLFLTKLAFINSNLTINFNYSRTIYTDLIAYSINALTKVGATTELSEDVRVLQISSRIKIYNELIRPKDNVHETILHAQVINALHSNKTYKSVPPNLWSSIENRVRKKIKDLFQDRSVLRILICPDGSFKVKFYDNENFLKILETLAFELSGHFKKVKVYVIAGKRIEYFDAFFQGESQNFELHNVSGQTNLSELFYVVENSDILIGNDTGPAHIALAYGKNTFVIHGAGHFGRFFPYPPIHTFKGYAADCSNYNCKWNCIYEKAICVNGVAPDIVSSDIIEHLLRNAVYSD